MKNPRNKQGLSRYILTISFASMLSSATLAQTYITPVRSDITPPTPQSAAIVEVQAPQPDLLTGAVSLSVPVYTVSADYFQLPVSLQYQSNGIKVFDDPAPVGFGWSLMPAMRITRTVLGRPDELFPFSGDPQSYTDPEGMCYMSTVYQDAFSNVNKGRYDSEHDIVSISLPDKTLTRVIDARGDSIIFIGASDSEYRVEADKNLNTIIVTDPSGTRYYFGGQYENSYDQAGNCIHTAWALFKIETDSGDTVNMTWSLSRHPIGAREWMGGYSFRDRWNPYQWGVPGGIPNEFDNDNYAEAVLSRNSETTEMLRLDKISFPGGQVDFDYDFDETIGPRLTDIRVSSPEGEVYAYTLSYNDGDRNLLTKIDGGEGRCHTFEYNTAYGTNPFHSMSTGRHSQDWWGYYNAKENLSLTPRLKVKTYQTNNSTDGFYRAEIGDADRSVDAEAMQALILKKVIWPTGGSSSFEYEPHSFSPVRLENDGEISPDYDPLLSEGGGLRVKSVTTSDGTSETGMTVRYEYPPAQVRAVPSASTFIEAYDVVFPMPDIRAFTDDPISRMRMVNIMPVSDYMRYDTGVTPLWYDHVTTIWPEGKTETYFEDIIDTKLEEQNGGPACRPTVRYGGRVPSNMAHVFDGTPAMIRQTVYRSDNGGYTPVESTEYNYSAVYTPVSIVNYHIIRNVVYLDNNEPNCPDLIDGHMMHGGPKTYGTDVEVENGYSSMPYDIYPYAKQLTSKSHTVYTETGDILSTEQYAYKNGTGLIEKITSGTSEGNTSVTTVDYADSSKGANEQAMIKANLTGVPLREKITVGSASITAGAEYVRTGSGAFRQRTTSVVYGNAADTVSSPVCEYNYAGRIIAVTDADGIRGTWTWDSDGLYPIAHTTGNNVTSFTYKPLVGLSSVTQPFGAVTTYSYDSHSRLASWSVNGLGQMQKIDYRFTPGENSISTSTWFDELRKLVSTEHYDNLGRKIMTEDVSAGISSHIRYDAMGRPYAQSLPSADAPSSDFDYAMSAYEPSPRGVVVSTVKNGETWHSGSHRTLTRTLANEASGPLAAPLYRITGENTAVHQGNYPAGQLIVEEITDENGHVIRKYTNKSGLVVMTEEGDGAGDMLRTRNIYDDYGRLRFILPPSFDDGDICASDDAFIKNCYEFHYDACGRLASQRKPGAAAFHRQVYSPAGRLVAEHTAPMSNSAWLVYFYDRQGRLVYTANAGLSDSEVEWHRQDFPVAEYTGNPLYAGYTLTPDPRIPVDNPYAAAYYDDYSFLDMEGASELPRLSGTRAGLQTGAYDKYSGYSSIEYDGWGRVTGGHSRTPMGILTTRQTLCRSGKPVTASAQLVTGSGRSYNMTSVYTYDNAGRSSAWTVTLGKEKAGAEYTYGKTGRVQTETFANGVKRRFAYDCHDWVESISTEIPNSLLIPLVTRANSSGDPDATAGDGSSLPALSSGEVSTDFYSAALSGGLVVDTTLIEQIKTTTYTERVLYADGDNPRYDGTASAHVSTLNGRYDYTYDCHDRLIKAAYTKVLRPRELSLQPVSVEDFSTSYSYNAVGAPLTLKRQGVIAPASEDGSTGVQYGLMDDLSYQWDGMLLVSVSAQVCGSEFYGRTGYCLSAKGGTGSYKWNGAGLLNADSARGIRKTYYNESGQPTSIEFTDKGHLDYTYSTSGELLRVSTYAMLPGGRRPTLVSERSYCGGFVFEGDSLIYANFPGGYFDGEGLPHYSHTDFQGNITMVTDRDGQLCQHTGYYPYGEPWREPAGQPYLYGGKERMRDGSLNDYDFSARRLNSALALWTAPDPMARDFSSINPYVYCASNPIRYTDPTGCSFTEGSQVYVDMLVADVKRQLKDNSKEILNSLQDLLSGNLSKKKVKDFNKKISDINKKNNDLKEVLSEIDVLSNSSQEYNITENSRLNTNTHFNSGTTFNPESKAIDITLGEVSLGHIAHELKHAFQFETGEISFGLFKDGSPFYDKSDEWEAYKRGAMFGQKMPKVLPDRYNQYQDGPCKVSDLGTEYLNDSKELQNYARLYRCAFRWKGKTYISTKLIGK